MLTAQADVLSHMSHNINSVKGLTKEAIQDTTMGKIKGDTRSWDYGSGGGGLNPKP